MLKSLSTEPSQEPVPSQHEEKPTRPASPRNAMRYPGDQPKAPPSPPPRQSDAARSHANHESLGQQE